MRITFSCIIGAFISLALCRYSAPLHAADWPAWRHDARRSGATSETLAPTLSLQWSRELPPLKPAWPDQPKVRMDASYEPIVLGKHLIVGSSWDDTVRAFSTETGKEAWRFYAEGPIRFAPVGWRGKAYVACDDGYLYCLDAAKGTLLWKHRGGPSERKILGNDRLISSWPARGAPVIADDTVYYAAGIWPFMGIFIHALDAQTGKVVWTNDGDGSIYVMQPHNASSFAGVAPQGPMVVSGDKLLIPGGRSVPACYDRKTGKLLYYELGKNGKRGGGSEVAATDKLILNNGAIFDLKTEIYLGSAGKPFVFSDELLYAGEGGKCRVLDLAKAGIREKTVKDKKGKKKKVKEWVADTLVSVSTLKASAMLKTAKRIYLGGREQIVAYDLPLKSDAKPVWQAALAGNVTSLLAADGRLFVVTAEGRIDCYGPGLAKAATFGRAGGDVGRKAEWKTPARSILDATNVKQAYVVKWGGEDGRFVKELAQRADLRIIVIEPDVKTAHSLRDELRDLGISAERVTVLHGDAKTIQLPPYLASAMVMTEAPQGKAAEALVQKLYSSLRPYGGAACFAIHEKARPAFADTVHAAKLHGAKVKQVGEWTLLVREGALPGSANWTHEHGDAQSSRVSKDTRVKAPFAALWFGGSSHEGILPRHGHGPAPQVVDGRLFIEGTDMIRALDIYTGRVLWEAKLPGVGEFYNKTSHEAGANASNGNYVSISDGIYVAYKNECIVLDPATGKRLKSFTLPKQDAAQAPPLWGYVSVYKDYLIGGGDPLVPPKGAKLKRGTNDTFSSSASLVVMDRHTGKVLWQIDAQQGFRHNAVCCGNDVLYCIDRLSGPQLDRLKRRGKKPEHPFRLMALDVKTGKKLWETDKEVFGTWLSCSEEHNVLVEAGRVGRDTIGDEPKGMRAYHAKTGKVLWNQKSYSGPAMIRGDVILMVGKGCELMTGKPWMREDPLTGKLVAWTWTRNYGCNTPAASEHLLTFRSGAAGYYDLCNDSGTGNFGGFRSSCTNNLIVAGGLLNAPDYTRTCSCSYQNQTSLALMHLPEAEMWTFYGASQASGAVKRVGLNFAAPGDRKADNGTFWVEYPSLAGRSPTLSVDISPEKPEAIRRHPSQVTGDGLSWVTASGLEGVTRLRIRLDDDAKTVKRYQVKLYFAELNDDVKPGERIFDVALQGRAVAQALDVVKETGGARRGLVRAFNDVQVKDALTIELSPTKSAKVRAALLCGVEIVAQD